MTEIQRNYLAKEDWDRIEERTRDIAAFKPGDRVTVEPTDTGIAYSGCHLEGALLTVKATFPKTVTIAGDQPRQRPTREEHRPDNFEARHVELVGDYEHATYDKVYISSVGYTFEEDVQDRMSESCLLSWDTYKANHDRVTLPTSWDSDTRKWLTQVEEGEECDLCGCNMLRESHWDNGVQQAGSVECAACGDTKEEYHP